MRNLWIALILLAVIGVIVFLVLYVGEEQPSKQDRSLYHYEEQSVEEIQIVSGNGEVSFVKKQNAWVMTQPKEYRISIDAVDRLENRLKDFLASRILDEAGELEKYGLDEPSARIRFKLSDGTEHTLLIGDMTASKVQYYAKDADADKIYILGSYDVENFLAPVSEFRDRSILTVNAETISTIGMLTEQTREFQVVGSDADEWVLSQPLEVAARGDAVKEMLSDILELKIKDFVDEEPDDLSAYGLDKPLYTLELADDKKNKQTIYFGKLDEDEQIVYIMLDDSNEVYTLSLEVFDPRRFKISNFLNEAPLSVAITDVNKVSIVSSGTQADFERDASKADDIFTYKGKDINMEYFTALYVNIMALAAEGYDPGYQGGTPELTVTLECSGGKTITAEFVKRDDLSYYFVLNGEARPYYVGERKVDLITRWTERVLEGM